MFEYRQLFNMRLMDILIFIYFFSKVCDIYEI